MENAGELLEKDLRDLELGQALLTGCKRMGFSKIADILLLSPEELIRKDGFSFHWLSELTGFMKAHGALHLLQNLPQTERTAG